MLCMVYFSFWMYNRENYINKGEYIMGTEKNNNNNEDRIFEISSKQRPEIENQSRLEDEEVTKNKKE